MAFETMRSAFMNESIEIVHCKRKLTTYTNLWENKGRKYRCCRCREQFGCDKLVIRVHNNDGERQDRNTTRTWMPQVTTNKVVIKMLLGSAVTQ